MKKRQKTHLIIVTTWVKNQREMVNCSESFFGTISMTFLKKTLNLILKTRQA